MTPEQIKAIKCAHADLLGALQNFEQGTYAHHDWKAHQISIEDLENEFPFLTDNNADNTTEDQDNKGQGQRA